MQRKKYDVLVVLEMQDDATHDRSSFQVKWTPRFGVCEAPRRGWQSNHEIAWLLKTHQLGSARPRPPE